MKKLLTTTSMVFILCSCSAITDKYEKPNCYKSVAIAKISIKEAHNSAAQLTTSKKIDKEDSKKSYYFLEQADGVIDMASSLCSLDEVEAFDYINKGYALIEKASNTMKGI